jgi:hypothetical protein
MKGLSKQLNMTKIEDNLKQLKYNKECITYKMNEEEIDKVNEKIYIKESASPTVSTKEYRHYRAYRKSNIKKIMQNYNNDKQRYKKDKLSKEQFMMMYMKDVMNKVNKRNRNKLNNKQSEVDIF